MLTLWKYLIILDKIEEKNNNKEKTGSKPGKKKIWRKSGVENLGSPMKI